MKGRCTKPIAPLVHLVTSKWDVSSNPGAVIRTGIFPHKKEEEKECPTSGERQFVSTQKFDFTVDEGKG